jgi:hypothetical protein
MSFRVGRLEQQLAEFMVRSEGWHNTLAVQNTALSNQIGTGLASLPEHYAPRREAAERHRAIEDHFKALEKQIEDHNEATNKRFMDRAADVDRRIEANAVRVSRLEQAGWGVALLLLGSLGTALMAYFKPH